MKRRTVDQMAEILPLVQRPEGVSNAELREVMRRSESHVGNLLNALKKAGQATRRKVPLEGLHKGVCVRWFGGDKPADAWVAAEFAKKAQAVTKQHQRKQPAIPQAKQQIKFARPAPVSIAARHIGALAPGNPICTKQTKRTIDATQRPNNRIEAAPDLPADPRWPSFGSVPLGVDPDTGRAWEAAG